MHLLADLDAGVDEATNTAEVILTHTTRSHGGSTDSDTHGGESALVTRSGVLVASNVDLLQDGLDTGTVKTTAEGLEVEEDHVVVGTTSNESVTALDKLLADGLGVLLDLLLVLLELRSLGLLQGDCESSNGVVVRTTLVTGEDGEVDWAFEVVKSLDLLATLHLGLADTLAEEDHGTTGTTERLVGGGGDNVGVLERRVHDASGDETGNVSHVDHHVAANLVANLAEPLVVHLTAVGRGTGDDDLGPVHEGILLELLVVDDAGLEVDAVRESLEVGGNGRDPEKMVSNAFSLTASAAC